MKYLEKFGDYDKVENLIIVDVQKSFRKFFTEMYLHELKKYCRNFKNVYQIFDNHVDGKNVDKEYLYNETPEIPIHDDLYYFPNQKDIIEKRYNYDVDSDFYKKILSDEVHKEISDKENKKQLKRGDIFPTKKGTHIVYIGNKHNWFHVSKKLYKILKSLKGKKVEIIGGSSEECFLDIVTSGESMGVNMKPNYKYIWSAAHCPIR